MKLLIATALTASLFGCGSETETFTVINGRNGHSIVSWIGEISPGVICPNGGKSVDFYVDLDDSLYADAAKDSYLNSVVTCNGANGLQGIPGLQGTQGEQGEQGTQGEQGEQGPRGIPGEAGPPGLDGETGQDGRDGAPGQDGRDGEHGPAGAPGQDGRDGEHGRNGAPGQDGRDGENGSNGSNGTDGINSTMINVMNSTSCTLIGAGYSYQNNKLYSNTTCSSSNSGRVNLQSGESKWVSGLILVVYDGSTLRSITFN